MSTAQHKLGLQVTLVDPQKKSIKLSDGTRLGFAQARRKGIDPETLQVERPELVGEVR